MTVLFEGSVLEIDGKTSDCRFDLVSWCGVNLIVGKGWLPTLPCEGSWTCTSGDDTVRVAADAARGCGVAAGGAPTAVSALLRVIARIDVSPAARSVSDPDAAAPPAALASEESARADTLDVLLRAPAEGSQPAVPSCVELGRMDDASGVVRRMLVDGGSTSVIGASA